MVAPSSAVASAAATAAATVASSASATGHLHCDGRIVIQRQRGVDSPLYAREKLNRKLTGFGIGNRKR